jgi:hypothetical protein
VGQFIFPFIFALFDIENINKAEPIITFTFNMFLLNLACLFCFTNIFGYLLALYLIDKYKDQLENKYPRLSKVIYYYASEATKMFWLLLRC